MIKYKPRREWPIRLKSLHDSGIRTADTWPLHSNRPSVWNPDELVSLVRPKLSRVIGRISLSEMIPAVYCNFFYYHTKLSVTILKVPSSIPLSVSFLFSTESQLHWTPLSDSWQFPSIPHWQMCTRLLFPDQKYFGSPFLSFHQE